MLLLLLLLLLLWASKCTPSQYGSHWVPRSITVPPNFLSF
jgi:hypothetical protein